MPKRTLPLSAAMVAVTAYADAGDLATTLVGSSLLLALAGFILFCVWLFLPFAIFGLKPLIRKLIYETQRTIKLLEEAVAQQKAALPAGMGHPEIQGPESGAALH